MGICMLDDMVYCCGWEPSLNSSLLKAPLTCFLILFCGGIWYPHKHLHWWDLLQNVLHCLRVHRTFREPLVIVNYYFLSQMLLCYSSVDHQMYVVLELRKTLRKAQCGEVHSNRGTRVSRHFQCILEQSHMWASSLLKSMTSKTHVMSRQRGEHLLFISFHFKWLRQPLSTDQAIMAACSKVP